MSTLPTVGPIGPADTQRLFEELAELTWGWLADARRLGLGFSEDTISDLAMLEIGRSGSNSVGVKRVSKRRERVVGFDWLWVILRSGRLPTFYVVQAKKLQLYERPPYSYGRLRYPTGANYQIDALEDFANWLGAVPMYCFYNNVDDLTAQLHWNCQIQRPPNPLQMGCTLAPLDVVRPIHDGRGPKNFHAIHWRNPEALPWRCLFHPSCASFSLGPASDSHPIANRSEGMNRMLEFLPVLTSGDEDWIDVEELVRQLDLDELVDRYESRSFTPIPDRIFFANLED